MPDQTQEETVKDRVQRLRLENQSIREIAKALAVTKYTVEKAVKELESDRRRALSEAAAARRRHLQQTATGPLPGVADMLPDSEKALPDVAVLLPDMRRTVPQTVQLTRVGSVCRSTFRGETRPETAGNMQKAPKPAPFVGMYGFMADFRWFLYDMQRLLRQPRIWAHTLRVEHLKKLEDLQARGRTHCLEQGFAYDELLLSEVLGACEDYVRGLISTVVVNPAMWGMESVRITQDEALSGLIKSALQKDSFFAVSGQSSSYSNRFDRNIFKWAIDKPALPTCFNHQSYKS